MSKVIVIGGGPAGTAAGRLRRNGQYGLFYQLAENRQRRFAEKSADKKKNGTKSTPVCTGF